MKDNFRCFVFNRSIKDRWQWFEEVQMQKYWMQQSIWWKEELRRHKRECNWPTFQKIVKYKTENGMFWWLNCQQKFTKKSNESCHVKNCKGEKQAVYHTCIVCSTVSQYKNYLKRHMKSHETSTMDDNFVPSLAFETADQVLPDQELLRN